VALTGLPLRFSFVTAGIRQCNYIAINLNQAQMSAIGFDKPFGCEYIFWPAYTEQALVEQHNSVEVLGSLV
jgi:hypothetical protein